MIKLSAPAKINLCLDITGKLDNGYHSLFMVMQSIGLCDEITLEKNGLGEIFLTCSESRLPADKRNIAHKAAVAFYSAIIARGIPHIVSK